ncbi:amidohydrolase [Fusobacterium sp. CM1]|uniref:amidohydrolase n=1 Tax=Fusobacterium sp. CM1 TaxID=936561 RepID=UPI002101B71D|nr:amidohydrolase [Fusobacterium sp. CM1]
MMHACGHDMHTSILLGTAMVLSNFKDNLKGNIKFMFQPSEEASPVGGAKGMIAEGLLENPKVDEAYGLHVFGVPTGSISIKSGVATSRSDRIDIEIFGKSSHASMPAEGKDAIVVAGNIITSIQSIISRNMPANQTAVITIGKISGGTRYNVLADYVKLEGTVRTFATENADMIKQRLEKIVKDIANAYDCIGKLHYQNGYDFIYNNPELSETIISSLKEILGKENVLIQNNPLPAGEDFSFISKKVPSVFLWLGVESDFNKGRCTLHSPDFLPDENAIKIGIKTLCKIAFDRLNN